MHLLSAFGPAPLNAISPADVRSWHGRLSQTGLHPNTVAKIYRLLRTILTIAVDDGVLPANPARVVVRASPGRAVRTGADSPGRSGLGRRDRRIREEQSGDATFSGS